MCKCQISQLACSSFAGEDFILSQRSGVEEELFKGDVLGVDADVRIGGPRLGCIDVHVSCAG